MFKLALVFFIISISTFLFSEKVDEQKMVLWLIAVISAGICITFLLFGIFSKKRLHEEDPESLP